MSNVNKTRLVLFPLLLAIAASACGRVGDASLLGLTGDGSGLSSPALSVSGISHSYGNSEFMSTTASPSVSWSSVSGVDGSTLQYEVALGTGTTGSTVNNAMNWTAVGSATSFTATNLNLNNKQNYYAHVRLANAAGKGPSAASAQPWKAMQTQTIYLYQKNTTTWNVIPGGGEGTLTYTMRRGSIKYDFTATNLGALGIANGTTMTLIYYPDPWPGTGLLCLNHGNVTAGGLTLNGEVNFGMDIPKATDANYPTGGKIWLVPATSIEDLTSAIRGSTCDGIVGGTAVTQFRYRAGNWAVNKDLTLYEDSLAWMQYVYEP